MADVSNTKIFIARSISIHGNKFDYNNVNYINNSTKVSIKCNTCNKDFTVTPKNHSHRNRGCPHCSHRINDKTKIKDLYNQGISIKNISKSTNLSLTTIKLEIKILKDKGIFLKCRDQKHSKEKFIADSKKLHGNKFDYVDVNYISNSTPINIKCNKHSFLFSTCPYSHKKNHGSCPKCLIEYRRDKYCLSLEDFIKRVISNYGSDAFDLSKVEYINYNTKVCVVCKKCDHKFYKAPSTLLAKRGSCPKCYSTISKISNQEFDWLNSIGLIDDENHRQVPIKIDGYKNKIRVDGFDPITNTIYLYHGTFYHAHSDYYNPDEVHPVSKIKNKLIYEKTIKQEQDIIKQGYNLIVMWEHEYCKTFRPTKFYKERFNK